MNLIFGMYSQNLTTYIYRPLPITTTLERVEGKNWKAWQGKGCREGLFMGIILFWLGWKGRGLDCRRQSSLYVGVDIFQNIIRNCNFQKDNVSNCNLPSYRLKGVHSDSPFIFFKTEAYYFIILPVLQAITPKPVKYIIHPPADPNPLFYFSTSPTPPFPIPSPSAVHPSAAHFRPPLSLSYNLMRNFSKDNARVCVREGVARTLTSEKVGTGGLRESEVRVGRFKYDSGEELGKGFSSRVYKGVEVLRPHIRVAIKVIDLRKFRGSSMDMLQDEISVHRGLDHEHVVKLLEAIKTSHHYYLVLEYCPHGNLSEYIAQKRQLAESNALQIAGQICSAYRYLMAEGVIHRDIKPANVLRAGNKWKLSDFGFAVKSRFAFKDRVNVGTPLYMAPESLKKNCYSLKSDIYAIGIVVYEMLVGRTPHEVDSEKELVDRLGAEIVLPKGVKNAKAVEFMSRACQISEAKRMSRQELENFDLGVGQASSVASINHCSSTLSVFRKYSGAPTDDSLTKKQEGSLNKRISGNSLSKDASKTTSRETSVYGSPREEVKAVRNPMVANREQLGTELEHVQVCYWAIQNIESFVVEESTRSMLMLGLFKFLLKVVRLLGDRGQNHFQLSNWEEYQQCRLHQDFLLSITTTSEQYEKEYLEFIRHNDIKVIRAVNRKFPQLSHNAPLTARFYDNFRAFLVGVLQEHTREVNALALHVDDPLNDRYQAFFAAASILKMAETRSTNPLASVPPDRTLLQDYTLSKRTKNDFQSGRRSLKSI